MSRRRREIPHPFLKWAGGKWDLLDKLETFMPAAPPKRYLEPFIGGGASKFGLCPDVPSILSDSNPRVIATYLAVRNHVDELIEELGRHRYEEAYFYETRARFNAEPDAPLVVRAAWMLFLNRVCVNGLYRENGDGEFNVSFGSYENPRICNEENLRACSAVLQTCELEVCDFAKTTARAEAGDLVYLDPPYIPLDGAQSFTAYRAGGFTSPRASAQMDLIPDPPTDHERLADECRALDKRGVSFVLSNSDTKVSRALYEGFTIAKISVKRSIGAGADRREAAPEIIVSNLR